MRFIGSTEVHYPGNVPDGVLSLALVPGSGRHLLDLENRLQVRGLPGVPGKELHSDWFSGRTILP